MKPQEETQKTEIRHCKMCGQEEIHTSSLSPKGYWICKCGHRTKEKPFEIIQTQFGHKFKKVRKKRGKAI